MIFVRGCISSQDDNGVLNTTVQFLKPPISMENIGKWCCQSGINCQTHWCIAAKSLCGWVIQLNFHTMIKTLPCMWSVAMMCQLKGTLTQITRLSIDLSDMPNQNTAINYLGLFHFLPSLASSLLWLLLLHTPDLCTIYSRFPHFDDRRENTIGVYQTWSSVLVVWGL